MIVALGLYQGFTALDAIGPYEVLTYLPGAEVVICAERAGAWSTTTTTWCTCALTRRSPMCRVRMCCLCPAVPAAGQYAADGHPIVDWIRRAHPQHRVDNLGMHRRTSARRRRAA